MVFWKERAEFEVDALIEGSKKDIQEKDKTISMMRELVDKAEDSKRESEEDIQVSEDVKQILAECSSGDEYINRMKEYSSKLTGNKKEVCDFLKERALVYIHPQEWIENRISELADDSFNPEDTVLRATLTMLTDVIDELRSGGSREAPELIMQMIIEGWKIDTQELLRIIEYCDNIDKIDKEELLDRCQEINEEIHTEIIRECAVMCLYKWVEDNIPTVKTIEENLNKNNYRQEELLNKLIKETKTLSAKIATK